MENATLLVSTTYCLGRRSEFPSQHWSSCHCHEHHFSGHLSHIWLLNYNMERFYREQFVSDFLKDVIINIQIL